MRRKSGAEYRAAIFNSVSSGRKTSGCDIKQSEGISVKEKEKEKWEFMKSYRQEV